ncbi:MAG: DUF5717 family protein [Lachnospiraceae bacterium]|nr:DUF5717 family protein [Lachnospiraceae bacterium]
MKKRVEQLLNGKFEYEVPPLKLSEEKLELVSEPGEVIHGSFTVSHPQEKKVKGFLYSSNPRVTFDPLEFYGVENKILYQADTSGLQPGEESEGCFTLCTDLGEYALPYRIKIQPKKKIRDAGGVMGTADLAKLAKEDFQAAYPIFISQEFAQVLERKEPERFPLYEALKSQTVQYQSLEEFLIGSGEKEPVELSLDQTEAQFEGLTQSVRETLEITKSSWGFLCMEITSDSRFLRPEKKTVTTDEFAGSRYQLEYIIDTNFLHVGKNYGRIRLSTCYQTLYFEVLVVKKSQAEDRRAHRIQKMMQKKLETLYVDFRLKRIEMQTWLDHSQNVIGGYHRAGGTDVFADLFLVQLLFADDKRTKGYRLLQEIEQQPQRLNTPGRYAFYLYISTFFHREISYVDQVEARIEQLFLQNRDNWVLQWVLLYLQERLLKDDAAKLEAIAEQVKYGCCSPIMYLEAFLLMKKEPFLLRRLDDFEQKVLFFAAREGLITEELAIQTGNLALHSRGYSRRLFEILKACYEVKPSPDVLKAICTILIAGDKKEPEYFSWYSLGVAGELRITGLYEYYMETMDECGIEKMPQIIRMYFVYNNTLDYHKRAQIYRNISDNRENIPQVYRSYRGALEKFVAEQLSMGRLDGNLAVLYERYLTRQILTRTLAERLVRMLFTFEITCKNPNMKSVAVVHQRMKGEQVVPLSGGKAQVQIYTEDARILLLDGQGNRYASTSLYMAERMLDTPQLIKYCREQVPDHPGLVLYMCQTSRAEHRVTKETLPYFKRACRMEALKEEYREKSRKWVLEYYLSNPKEEDLFSYLKEISYPEFIRADKQALMSLLTQEGMYEEAFRLLEQYGSEQVSLVQLVRICGQTVLAREYEENQVLLSYCYQCFDYGKYDDNILNYLLMYYDGPIEDMKRLWNTGRQFELDTMVLEEKILSLLLFTRTGSSGTEQIFASYHRKLGRKKICRAYIILKAYEYFVKDLPVNDLIFTYIEKNYQNGAELEDVCLLALLEHYSRMVSLTPEQERMVSELLLEYNGRGMRFAFYQAFPLKLRRPYQLEDKVFLEYVASPEDTVMLYYRIRGQQEEYLQEPMKNCFEGIYVKEFILFYGEELECYTQELREEQVVKTSDKRILTARAAEENGSRYDLLNRICRAQEEQDTGKLTEALESYGQLDYLTKEIFTLI